MAPGFTLFDTPVGRCGIAWSEAGVCGLALPGRDDAATLAALSRHGGVESHGDLPAFVVEAVARVRALLDGGAVSFDDIPLDLGSVPAFNRAVYDVILAVPAGRTITYGEIAARLGEPGAARAVGRALGENPIPVIVPCHRVLAAGGRAGGFSAPGGLSTKRRLLAIESRNAPGPPDLFSRLG
jgi:methylated-DNA-[protein]-cysteine S-methyltransferase